MVRSLACNTNRICIVATINFFSNMITPIVFMSAPEDGKRPQAVKTAGHSMGAVQDDGAAKR